jgi:hypothetical protein
MEILPLYWPGEAKKNHEMSVSVARVPNEIRNKYFQIEFRA